MSDLAAAEGAGLSPMRRHKEMFDNTWTLSTVLIIGLVVLSWYFGLAQLDIGAIVWTLAALAVLQLGLSACGNQIQSGMPLRLWAFASQLSGTMLLGVAWHLMGGVQQPLFLLFAVLPLLPASLLLNVWQQQAALVVWLMTLGSGLLLSPDTNSFIAQHYGLSTAATPWLPAWFPRSHVAFTDISTSPPYNFALIITVAAMGVALSTTARALVGLFRHETVRMTLTLHELARVETLNAALVTRSPLSCLLVQSASGRIVQASECFVRDFQVPEPQGRFLLDTIAFSYPSVVKRLLRSGGEELLEAVVGARIAVLRLRVESIGDGESQLALMSLESREDVYWRAEVDALDEPAFIVSAAGCAVCMNAAARTIFGAATEGMAAASLFDAGAGWWDIAPLEVGRRILQRQGHEYLAVVRRARSIQSLGELCFVRLYERAAALGHDVAA